MEENNYSINLRDLSIYESLIFPDSFKEYSEMAEFLLRRKSMFILEDNLIELHKDEPDVKDLMELGNIPIGAITAAFPNRFLREGMHPKIGGAEDEGVWGWLDLWSDYVISPQDELYDLFFTYKLKHTDILEMDNILNFFSENYNSVDYPIIGWKNATRARQLVNQGLQVIAENPSEQQLIPICIEIENLLPDQICDGCGKKQSQCVCVS